MLGKSIDHANVMLALREVINIAVVVLSFILIALTARYVLQEFRRTGYRRLEWPVKLSIGLFFIFLGEMVRSATAWLILHTEGPQGTYLSDIFVMICALVLIVLGSLCAIRVLTPVGPCSGKLWQFALGLTILMAAINLVL